jgi:hypothetical protein
VREREPGLELAGEPGGNATRFQGLVGGAHEVGQRIDTLTLDTQRTRKL